MEIGGDHGSGKSVVGTSMNREGYKHVAAHSPGMVELYATPNCNPVTVVSPITRLSVTQAPLTPVPSTYWLLNPPETYWYVWDELGVSV
jgi:hypothetical protein